MAKVFASFAYMPLHIHDTRAEKIIVKGLKSEAIGRNISNFVSSNMLGYCNIGPEWYPITMHMEKQDRRSANDLLSLFAKNDSGDISFDNFIAVDMNTTLRSPANKKTPKSSHRLYLLEKL